MSQEILLPQLGFGMTDGKLVEWLVPDGSTVAVGDLIFALETDKSTQEIESPGAGKLKILKEPDTYEVGTILGLLE